MYHCLPQTEWIHEIDSNIIQRFAVSNIYSEKRDCPFFPRTGNFQKTSNFGLKTPKNPYNLVLLDYYY